MTRIMASIVGAMAAWRDRRRRAQEERDSLRLFGCACFCPKCQEVLQFHRITIERLREGLYVYECECGERSRFDFLMAPVPIHVDDKGNQIV